MPLSFSGSNSCFADRPMRLVTFSINGQCHLGVRKGSQVVDLGPGRRKDLLASGGAGLERARRTAGPVVEERAIRYLPPVPDADKFLCVARTTASTWRSCARTSFSPRR